MQARYEDVEKINSFNKCGFQFLNLICALQAIHDSKLTDTNQCITILYMCTSKYNQNFQ